MRIDLDIGEMNFVFTRSVWNPQSHEYSTFTDGAWDGYDGENNRIRITNNVIVGTCSQTKVLCEQTA